MKSESFLTLHRQQCNWNVPRSRNSKDIVKIVHVTSVVQPQFYEAMRILFVHKENKNNKFIQQYLLLQITYSAIMESTTMHAHCFSLHVNKAQRMRVLHQQHHTNALFTCICTPDNGGRRDLEEKNCWIKLFVFFAHKKYTHSFVNYGWTTDVAWTILLMSLLRCVKPRSHQEW